MEYELPQVLFNKRAPKFTSLAEMERWYYGDLNADMIRKDSGVALNVTGFQNVIYGAKVWSQINYEANAFAAIPKEPWVKSGWRLETAAGYSFPSGALAEGSSTAYTAIPATAQPTITSVSAPPEQVGHTWGATLKGFLADQYDDTFTMDEKRRQCGMAHARAISAYMVRDVDTVATNAPESIDRIASSSTESGQCNTASDGDIYGLDRTTGSYDAQVSSSGSATTHLRDLTLSLIEQVWSSVTVGGGKPKVIITNDKTRRVLSALLEAERRFNVLEMATFVPRFNAATGYTPGLEGGFSVATYYGVPIIPCQDYDSNHTVRTNEIAPFTFIDTDYVRFAVQMPTKYMETDTGVDMLTGDRLAVEGMYLTIGETRCYNFAAQGKLSDIK